MFVRVDISDTGKGIPEEDQPKIFGRFYRGTSTKSEEGVGIGLHLAREIVSGQGGYIKVKSISPQKATLAVPVSPDQPVTTFSVFLPK